MSQKPLGFAWGILCFDQLQMRSTNTSPKEYVYLPVTLVYLIIFTEKDVCGKKTYAVVTFINESDPSEETIAEVPTKWLTDDQGYCYWPSSANTNLYIKRLVDPRKSWPLHPVRVDGYYDTLKDAQKQSNESNTETEHQGRGCRIVKAPSPFSPDEDFLPKCKKPKQISRPPELDGSLKHATQEQNNNKENEAQIDGFTDSYALSIISQHNSNEFNLRESNQNNSQPLVTDQQSITSSPSGGNFTSGSGNYFENITNLDNRPANRLENESELTERRHLTLVNMLSDIFIQLGEIRQDIAGITKNPKINSNDDIIRIQSLLPCKKLENLQELENLVNSDEKYRNIWYQIVKSTGGNGSRDFIIRVLRKLITNGVAEICSWTGAKNNFKIKDLTVFQIFITAVQDSTGVTQCDFEIFVKEWLRHSKQRREREENRNNN